VILPKNWLNHLSKKPGELQYYQFPELAANYFHKAELKDGVWLLEGAPPDGIFVFAKVSADGKWVQMTRVGFAPK